jgi:hypothetical protein
MVSTLGLLDLKVNVEEIIWLLRLAVALNCWVEPRFMDAVVGETVTVTGAGGVLLPPPPPQAVSINPKNNKQKIAKPEIRFRKLPMNPLRPTSAGQVSFS